MMDRLYRSEIRLVQVSDSILDPTGVTSTISPDYQPSEDAVHIDCRVVDHTEAGSVRVIGAKDGSPVEEILSVDIDGFSPVSLIEFDSITKFEVTGLSGGSIAAAQTRGQGEPILRELFIKTIWGDVVAKSGNLRAMEAGQADQGKYLLATLDDEALKVFPNRYLYVQQGEQEERKFILTFVTPPGRLGNVIGDLKLL